VAVDLVTSDCPHEVGTLTGYIFVKLFVTEFSFEDKFQLKIAQK